MTYSTSSALPRQELALAVVEGENAVQGLIGDKILGGIGINYRNAHLVKATLADTLGLRQIADTKYIHAPGTKFQRLTATFGDASLSVTPRGVEIAVPNEMMKDYANHFDVLSFFSARFGTQISSLTKEKLIADAVFNTTNLGSATNSAVAYTTGNQATNSFIADVIDATRRGRVRGEIYDSIAMSGPVYERIRQSSKVQGYVSGTLYAGADTTLNNIQKVLAEYGIKQVLVADGYYNDAADGATPSLSQIWSNTYIAVFKAGMQPVASQTEGVGVPTISGLGGLVYWEGYDAGGVPSSDKGALTFEGGNYVETYPSTEIDSMIIRVKLSHKPAILNSRCGELIATQYS